jgi:hypothetical protein
MMMTGFSPLLHFLMSCETWSLALLNLALGSGSENLGLDNDSSIPGYLEVQLLISRVESDSPRRRIPKDIVQIQPTSLRLYWSLSVRDNMATRG